MKGINIFQHIYLYSAYTEDTTFFLRDKRSIKKLINTFAAFSKYSGLKPNHEKYEIAGIRVLKSVKVVICGMKCIDLSNDTEHLIYSFKNLSIFKTCFSFIDIKSPYRNYKRARENSKNFFVVF